MIPDSCAIDVDSSMSHAHDLIKTTFEQLERDYAIRHPVFNSYAVLKYEMEFYEYKEVVRQLYGRSHLSLEAFQVLFQTLMKERIAGTAPFCIPFHKTAVTPTHILLFQLMYDVAAVRNLAEVISYLSGGEAQCAQLVIDENGNAAHIAALTDNFPGSLTDVPPTLHHLSECVFSEEGELVIHLAPFQFFNFAQHRTLYRTLMMYYPTLAKKVYQHNPAWVALGEKCREYARAQADLTAGLALFGLHQPSDEEGCIDMIQSSVVNYSRVAPTLAFRVVMQADFLNPDQLFASLATFPTEAMNSLWEVISEYRLNPEVRYLFVQRVVHALTENAFTKEISEAIIASLVKYMAHFELETCQIIQAYFISILSDKYKQKSLSFLSDKQLYSVLTEGVDDNRVISHLLSSVPGVMLRLLDQFKDKDDFKLLLYIAIPVHEHKLSVIQALAVYDLAVFEQLLHKIIDDSDRSPTFRNAFKQTIASCVMDDSAFDEAIQCMITRSNASDEIGMQKVLNDCVRLNVLRQHWTASPVFDEAVTGVLKRGMNW